LAFVTDNGSVLLNPAEKGLKYSIEIKHKKALTNNGKRKLDKNGKQKKLTKEQIAYRAGYLAHQKDSNKAFKAKHPRYKSKTTKR
jgi:hypothetical protein